MPIRRCIPLAIAVAALLVALAVPARSFAQSSAPPPQLDLADNAVPPLFQSASCPPDVFPATARVDCGFVTVPENRSRPHGRMIRVAAAVVHAPAAHPKRDPIVFLDGGPSFGAISPFALDSYFAGAAFIQDRDLILVDTRGTGISEPRLGCPEFDRANDANFSAHPIGSTDVENFTQAVKDCRNRLTAAGIDLAAYTSAESAADLDALRRALHYSQWNLLAISADGVLGLTYMRLYPDHIRSAIIDSGQSTQYLPDIDDLIGINAELERIFKGCAANAACNAAYPNIRQLFFRLVHTLQDHPVEIPLPNFPGRPNVFYLDGISFYQDMLFTIFPGNKFAPESIHQMLASIWRATHSELVQLYQEGFDFSGGPPPPSADDTFYAQGKTLSYRCHDLFITRADIEQAARELPELAPHFLDPNYGLPIGPAGCRIWHVGRADAVQHQPVVSAIPTLVLAGEYDTGVPPRIVRQIPKTLSHSFFYEFPAAPHLQLASFNPTSSCARAITVEFLEEPSERPDSPCIAKLPPFDFTPPGPSAPVQPKTSLRKLSPIPTR